MRALNRFGHLLCHQTLIEASDPTSSLFRLFVIWPQPTYLALLPTQIYAPLLCTHKGIAQCAAANQHAVWVVGQACVFNISCRSSSHHTLPW